MDNGMITRLIPYKTEARPNLWRFHIRTQLFHLPLRVPDAMFDGIDDVDDGMPIM
jgi:hypothetical protein